jgi:hypothetical protein
MSLAQGRPLPYFSSAVTAEAAVKMAAPRKLEMRMVVAIEVANVIQKSRLWDDICIGECLVGCSTRRLRHFGKAMRDARRLIGMSHSVSRAASILSRPIEDQICGLEQDWYACKVIHSDPLYPMGSHLANSGLDTCVLRINTLAGSVEADSFEMEHRSHSRIRRPAYGQVECKLRHANFSNESVKDRCDDTRLAVMRYLPKVSSFYGTAPLLTQTVSRSKHT